MKPPVPGGTERGGEPPSGWKERLAALRNVPPLLKMVWATSPVLASASVGLRMLTALLPVAMLYLSKLILDTVVAALAGKEPLDPQVWVYLGAELGLAILGDGLGRATGLCDSLLGDLFTNHISLRMMEHANRLDLVSFEDPVFYDKMERARRQTTSRLGMLAGFASTIQQSITFITLTLSILWFSPLLLLLLVLAVIPVFMGETKFAMLAYSLLYRYTPERRELDYLRMLGASNASAKEVKIFGLGNYLVERARGLFEKFYQENRKLARKRAFTGTLLNILPTAAYYGAYAYIVHRTVTGSLTAGDLTFLTGAFARSRGLIEQIFAAFSSIADQAFYVQDLFDFFRTEPTIKSPDKPIPVPRPIRSGFEFQGVSFAYPGSSKLVLDKVDFTLDAGERIALIGENGAGKTTLVKLLSRLYEPTEGRILLDGVDLRDYSVEDLRNEVGVIFQDYMRYDMRVTENIGFGRVEELNNWVRLEEAARKGYTQPVIDALPGGWGQMLGRRFDTGVDLSAGQWQKVALARAYMRDPQVLILDEPTASLDARAEYEVFVRFAELTRDKMAVLISHRFSTVRMADRILVLENGKILEQGTHGQLVALGGRYAELFDLQAAGYR